MAAVEGVLGGDGEVFMQQVVHGAAVEPVAVEAPFAAGFQQAVAAEELEDVFPVGAFARGAESLSPEGVELEFFP